MTRKKSTSISMDPEREVIFSVQVVRGPAGPHVGCFLHRYQMVAMNRPVKIRPGSTPPMNSLPMDTPVCSPMMMSTTLGGMTTPRVAPEATVPVPQHGVVTVFLHFRQGHGAHGGGRGRVGAADGRKPGAGQNRGHGDAAPDGSHPHVGRVGRGVCSLRRRNRPAP